MIDMIRKVRKDTKIAMFLTVPPAATQDAFCGNQTRWQYKRNQQRVVERMIGKYGNREAEHIYLVPSNVNLDTMHNYPVLNGPLNSRTKVEGARLSNGVHPSGEGQSQIGDSIYCWLKAQLAPVMPSGGGGQNRKGK